MRGIDGLPDPAVLMVAWHCAGRSAVEFVIVGPRADGHGRRRRCRDHRCAGDLLESGRPGHDANRRYSDRRRRPQAIDRLGMADAINDLENFNTNDTSPANMAKAQDIANRHQSARRQHVVSTARPDSISRDISASTPSDSTFLMSRPAGGFRRTPVTVKLECEFRLNHRRRWHSRPGGPASGVLLCLCLCRQDILNRHHGQNPFKARRTMERRTFRVDRTSSSPTISARPTISTTYGIDVGAIYRPSSWLRFGVVAKDLNQPEFDAPDGTKIKLGPQVRGGMAINPYSSLTLSADVDMTSNKTLVPGVKSQLLSLGAEQTILTEFLVVPRRRLQEHAGSRHAVHAHGRTGSENFRFSSRLGRRV